MFTNFDLRRSVARCVSIACISLFVLAGAWRSPDPPCPQDLDGNRLVDLADVALVLLELGPCPEPEPPVIERVSPTHGSVAGGTTVVLHGRGMIRTQRVLFGGRDAQEVLPISDAAVQVLTPAGSEGPVDVIVISEVGTGVRASGFDYRVESSEQFRNGPIVFGSTRASRMLQDLATGKDSLDVVLVGDSNTGNAQVGMWGFHGGFSQAFHELGWPCYALPVYPTMTGLGVPASSTGGWHSSAYLYTPHGNLMSGRISGSATPFATWSTGTDWIRYGSASANPPSGDDWAYIPSGTYSNRYNAVDVREEHPLNDSGVELWHRVRFGTLTSPGGSLQARASNYDGSAIHAVGPVQSTQGSEGVLGVYEYPFRVTSPPKKVHASWSGGPAGAVGPCAVHSHTIYVKRRGWSVTSHGYFAGFTSTRIANAMSGIGQFPLQLQLLELRERQISAGGSGRVLLIAQSGINGNETAGEWLACHQNLWNLYKSAWSGLGYPEGDLAMVSFVSVPANESDASLSGADGNLVVVRAAASQLPAANPDMTVVDVKKIMPFSRAIVGIGNGRSFFRRTGNLPNAGPDDTAHLSGGFISAEARDSSDGFTCVSHGIIQALLNTP